MAPKTEEKKKRRNKRKARTEVSSPISSDSESSAPSSPAPPKKQKKQQPAQTNPVSDDDDVQLNEGDNAISIPERKPKQDPEKVFEEFYLRQATKEFANDLDKLRSAGDFNDRSVSMLIRSLKQGTKCFTTEERMRIGSSLTS